MPPPTGSPLPFGGAAPSEMQLRRAAAALAANRPQEAEPLLRELLDREPFNVAALQLLAEVAQRAARLEDAQSILGRVLTLEPDNAAARHRLAMLLWQQNRWDEALAETERLLARDPAHAQYRDLKATILAQAGRLDEAIAEYAALLEAHPKLHFTWMRYGNALRIAGRREDAVAAWRQALALKPNLGEAWCSLANLKTFRFAARDAESMRAQIRRGDLGKEDRVGLYFALGKALEDEGRHAESFEHYAKGNALWRSGLAHDAAATSALVARCKAVFTREFFAEREGYGAEAADPIFIVGLPRSGSTLVEQMLASHSQVEGTAELQEMIGIARRLDQQAGRYPEAVRMLSAAAAGALGATYLQQTRIHRRTERPFFIDKMPNNFLHAGLIHLILPKAKIVDVRRGAMACCFSNFTHHFARGQEFSYELSELGRYFADYVSLMAHFDAALPRLIHRVDYETLVADPESEIGKLLDYLGLPFEEACLRFFETDRPVRSASSEQVRRPIFRESLARWRPFEPWLGPLKSALGPLAGQ
jgi:tetratricopeptide (TPR) repeat protein